MALSESQIRYAMDNTGSNNAAAHFLKVGYLTYRKYAMQYIDSASGKTLWELHLNQAGNGIQKYYRPTKRAWYLMSDILKGNYPGYPAKYVKRRVIKEGIKSEICEVCGYHERRITDQKSPLVLEWLNGDMTDHRKDNLRMICYNCLFTNVGDVFLTRQKRSWCF